MNRTKLTRIRELFLEKFDRKTYGLFSAIEEAYGLGTYANGTNEYQRLRVLGGCVLGAARYEKSREWHLDLLDRAMREVDE